MTVGRMVRHTPVVVDQALSSASNFLLALLVAQSASAADFGRFALAATVYWLFLGGLRALVAEPLLILQARHGRSRPEMSSAAGLAVAIAGAGSLVGGVLALLAGIGPIAVLLLCLPVLIWQDLLRYSAFSLDRPLEALISDAVWLVLFGLAGAALLLGGDGPSVSVWLLVWAACAVPGALTASVRLRVWPTSARQRAWWSRSRRQSVPMLGDFALLSLSESGFIFFLPLVASLALLGQVKAAMVVNGPLSVLMTAASVVALPLLARRRASSGAIPVRTALAVGSVLAGIASCYALVIVFLPPAWGTALFGDSWVGVGWLPAFLAFQYVIVCFGLGGVLTLRAIGEVRRILFVRLVMVGPGLVVPLVAARLGGATALGVSFVVMSLVYALLWWAMTLRLQRRPSVVLADPVPA